MLKRITISKTALDLDEISDEINKLFTSDKIDHSNYNVLTQSMDRKKEKLKENSTPSEISTDSKPPIHIKGEVRDDGYEWVQYPENSGKWWFRVQGSNEWSIWKS